MDRSTIIVAGGSGKRMGASRPKQFLLLKGRPLLCWTIEAFRAHHPEMPIIVVLPEAQISIWQDLCSEHSFSSEHQVVVGGEERHHSVKNGLATVLHDGLVAVHDGVRPLVSKELIALCFAAAQEHGAAIPVTMISSSLREINPSSQFPERSRRASGSTSPSTALRSKAVDRSRFRAVQTPQCFRLEVLRRAFELPYDPAFTDEATLVERLGVEVQLVEGEERNIKVTTPFDLQVAEAVLQGAA